MSKAAQINSSNIDSQDKDINYYMNKKNISNNKKTKQVENQSSSIKSNINHEIIANTLYTTKEQENTNNNNNGNNNNSNQNTNNNNQENKFITISDIIGEKCKLNLDILRIIYSNYDQCKTSKKKMGIIKSYGVNTYQGIVRNYNEDRVSIIINMNKPKNFNKKNWPKISFFGIYDGHGGEGCSEYLKDNLHKLICYNNEFFPDNIPEAIKLGFQKAESDFINNYALNDKKEIIDRSGSCAVILLMVDKKIYVANVGDSRCLLSMENGKKYVEVTKDHKPNFPNEIKRIKKYGGYIYQTETVINNNNNPDLNGKILLGPYRVFPGRLSVSRTLGDAEAKLIKYGGNPNVIIAEPEIFIYDLNKDDIDFFILGCDGIYDQISSNEVLDCAWMILNEKDNSIIKQIKDVHSQSGAIVDFIIKSALSRKSFDNVTCLFIALKFLGAQFIEQNENNEKKENTNLQNLKEKGISIITPNITPFATLSIKDSNNYEKNNKNRKKTLTSNSSQNDYVNDENKNNNINNNNHFYFSKYREAKKHTTEYKIRNIKLKNAINNINDNETNNNTKNNKIGLSHTKKPLFEYKNYKNNKSLSRLNSYSTEKNNFTNRSNTNREVVKLNNNYNSNTYSSTITPTKSVFKRNFGMEKGKEEPSYFNNNTSYEFKPSSRYNYSRKNIIISNNNSVVLNNINNLNDKNYGFKNNNNYHANTTSHRYLTTTQRPKNNNIIINYTSIRNNYKNLNQQNKNPINYQNKNSYSSISEQKSYNQRNIISHNNTDNNNLNNNNNNSINYNNKNYFTSKYKRNTTSNKREEPTTQKSDLKLRQPIEGKVRISNYYSLNNNNNIEHDKKPLMYKGKTDKNYQNYTHNSNVNNKYSNYTIADIKNNKKSYGTITINKSNINSENEVKRYNTQQLRKRGDYSNVVNNTENNYIIFRNRRGNKNADVAQNNNENNKGENRSLRFRYNAQRH